MKKRLVEKAQLHAVSWVQAHRPGKQNLHLTQAELLVPSNHPHLGEKNA